MTDDLEELRKTDHLVFNIGNTKVMAAAYAGDHLLQVMRYEVRSGWLEELSLFLREILSKQKQPHSIKALVASINTPASQKLGEYLRRHEIHYSSIDNNKLSIDIRSKPIEDLGADRVADCYGALKLNTGNTITINFGTAIAINAINEQGFLGGTIVPGIEMSARALSQQTYLLPFVPIDRPKICTSTTTEGNICAGIYYGVIGALKEVIARIREECFPNDPVTVIATGGLFFDDNNTMLTKHLKEDLSEVIDRFEPQLTLLGLNQIFLIHNHQWFVEP